MHRIPPSSSFSCAHSLSVVILVYSSHHDLRSIHAIVHSQRGVCCRDSPRSCDCRCDSPCSCDCRRDRDSLMRRLSWYPNIVIPVFPGARNGVLGCACGVDRGCGVGGIGRDCGVGGVCRGSGLGAAVEGPGLDGVASNLASGGRPALRKFLSKGEYPRPARCCGGTCGAAITGPGAGMLWSSRFSASRGMKTGLTSMRESSLPRSAPVDRAS